MFTHITNTPFTTIDVNSYTKVARQVMFFGKPLGLWYAPDLVWVKRMDSVKSWDITTSKERPGTIPHILDYYTSVLEKKEIPSGTEGDVGSQMVHYMYNFPLKDAFETDINKPDVSKIFKLSASNIDAFEASLQPWLTAKYAKEFSSTITSYEMYLSARQSRYFEKDTSDVLEFLASKGIAPSDPTYLDKYLRYMVRACLIKLMGGDLREMGTFQNNANSLGLTVKEFKPAFKKAGPGAFYPDGLTKNIDLCDRIRMYDYGTYFQEVMGKKWGGIDYDQSLFTPELETKYPYLPYVELPSGCMWQPTNVMPNYAPKPIAVLGLAKNQADAAKLTASVPDPYKNQLYIATINNGNLVMLKKGTGVGGRRTRRKKLGKSTRKHR